MLKGLFSELCARYGAPEQVINELWTEIETAYAAPSRHYHNLMHLENLYREIKPVLHEFSNQDASLFALFYHDLIYETSSSENELQSAQAAIERMIRAGCDQSLAEQTAFMIRATKGHTATGDHDTDLFTDGDLGILGQSTAIYNDYAEKIRKEYASIPDEAYYAGRARVLRHFLEMPHIFKTKRFYDRYETPARENISRELAKISEQHISRSPKGELPRKNP